MKQLSSYRLSGFIQYANYEAGFVTPVFVGADGVLYFQLVDEFNNIDRFEKLADNYFSKIQYAEQKDNVVKQVGEKCMFGFKWNDHVEYATSETLATYLSNETLLSTLNSFTKSYVQDFITEDRASPVRPAVQMEPPEIVIHPEKVWDEWVHVLNTDSFGRNIQWKQLVTPLSFANNVLQVRVSSNLLSKILYPLFKKLIRSSKGSYHQPGVHLDIVTPSQNKIIGRHIILKDFELDVFHQHPQVGFKETAINPFLKFSNYTRANFNAHAHFESESYCHSKEVRPANRAFVITGARGTGKTHLINAVANHFTEHRYPGEILFLKAYDFMYHLDAQLEQHSPEEIFQSFSSFRAVCIDDAQEFENEQQEQQIYYSYLTYLSKAGIRVLLTYNLPDEDERANRYNWSYFQHVLEGSQRIPVTVGQIKKPSIKDKITMLNTSNVISAFRIGKEALNQIATMAPDNLSDLKKGLTSVLIESTFKSHLVNHKFAKRTVQSFFEKQNKLSEITFDDLAYTISQHLEISSSEVSWWSNDRLNNVEKQVFYFFADLTLDREADTVASSIVKDTFQKQYSILSFQERVLQDRKLQEAIVSIYHDLFNK